MIDITAVVTLVFQIINFLVIMGLGLFVFKKYLLDILRAHMKEKAALITNLKNSYHTLTRNYQLLDRTIEQNLQVQSELKEKVMRWRAQVDHTREQLHIEKGQRRKKLDKQMKQQIEKIQEHILYQRVLPGALEEARALLVAHYANETTQNAYLAQTIHQLITKGRA